MYIDANNYAVLAEKGTDGVSFYKNGKLVKSVPCMRFINESKAKGGYYILYPYSKSCTTESGYAYYNADGEKAFDKSFKYANLFDNNNRAVVKTENNKVYLINTKGEKISEEYDSITTPITTRFMESKYYIVKSDSKVGLIDLDGKVVFETKYSRITYTSTKNNYIVSLSLDDSNHSVYDLKNNKELAKSSENPDGKENYFRVKNNNVNQYYTYSGKLIYED